MAPDPDRYLGLVGNELNNVEALLDQLVEFARIEAGQRTITRESVSVAELAHEAIEALAPVGDRRQVQLELQASGPAMVTANSLDISRVMRNLIENAIRHSPTASTVRVSVLDSDHHQAFGPGVTARVVDEGAGFPSDFRDHAFEPFTRADPARATHTGHAGLGLAITRALVQQHGGQVWLGSGPGGDVCLWFPHKEHI